MKNLKRWVLILASAGPSVVHLSCTSVLLQDVQDSVLAAMSSFVGTTTLDLLGNLGLGGV